MSVSHRYCSEKRFISRIEEDFNSTVGEQKEKFEQHLHCEILVQVDIQIPRRMIQDIDVSPGKIIYGILLLHSLPPLLLPLLPPPLPLVAELYTGFIFFRKEIVHAMSC
jgi:hypothetical protein